MTFSTKYNYQKVDGAAHFKDYFRISSNFGNDIHLGLSDGFNGHEDDKWEIVIGGWKGGKHAIRDGNQAQNLVSKSTNPSEFNLLKKDFILQVTDGKIAVYQSDSGRKGIRVMELNDQRIKKSKLNTLVASGGHWPLNGSGEIHFRGYTDNFPEIEGKSHLQLRIPRP